MATLRREVGVSLEPGEVMRQRLDWLRGIPFAAILTTNFDSLLSGNPPTAGAFHDVLRPRQHRWWERRFWDERRPGPLVVKLHGDVAQPSGQIPELVLSRRDYRQLLYGTPGYLTFLRSLFAIRTVLYLGFSFTDAYLNELRSEVLALLGHGSGSGSKDPRLAADPIAYAVVNDVSEAEAEYYRRHEGIEILGYDSATPPNHGGFDAILASLHAATNPAHLLGSLLAGRRLLWVDPRPLNNEAGRRFVDEATRLAGDVACEIESVGSVDAALAALAAAPPARANDANVAPPGTTRFDLVITHWGHGQARDEHGTPCAAAERLLAEIRRRDHRLPVIVFADPHHAATNRPRALRLGAYDFTAEWPELFRSLARLFGGAAD